MNEKNYTCDCQLKHLIYSTNTFTPLDTNTTDEFFVVVFASAFTAGGTVGILHFFAVVVVNAEHGTKEFIDFRKSASKSNCFHIHKTKRGKIFIKSTNKHWQTIEVSLFSENSHT